MIDTPVAEVHDISKLFGRFVALRHVTTSFERGRFYVLLGENGAGKSTLLRVLAGLLAPTAGRILIDGQTPSLARHRIGYMSHAPMLYDELTGAENLSYFGRLYRTQPCLTPEAALRGVGLDPTLPRLVGHYSQGMRQRTSLARVLLPQPDLLLLDEPFSNMDIVSARGMLELVARIKREGKTVLLTTHQRELAEPIADYLLTLQAGALVSVVAGPAIAGPALDREADRV